MYMDTDKRVYTYMHSYCIEELYNFLHVPKAVCDVHVRIMYIFLDTGIFTIHCDVSTASSIAHRVIKI